jgi:hypothetical protein
VFLDTFRSWSAKSHTERSSGRTQLWKLTPLLPSRDWRALIVARKSSAVPGTITSFSPFKWAERLLRHCVLNEVRKPRVSWNPETKMGVLFVHSPAEATLLVRVVPGGMPYRGPDMSVDMRLVAASEEAAGSGLSDPLAEVLGSPPGCVGWRAQQIPLRTPAHLCREAACRKQPPSQKCPALTAHQVGRAPGAYLQASLSRLSLRVWRHYRSTARKGSLYICGYDPTNIKECVLDTTGYLVGKSTREQETHGLHRKWSVKWMDQGDGRMSTTKKAGRTKEDWGMNWKDPQTILRRNILRTHATRSYNFKEHDFMV